MAPNMSRNKNPYDMTTKSNINIVDMDFIETTNEESTTSIADSIISQYNEKINNLKYIHNKIIDVTTTLIVDKLKETDFCDLKFTKNDDEVWFPITIDSVDVYKKCKQYFPHIDDKVVFNKIDDFLGKVYQDDHFYESFVQSLREKTGFKKVHIVGDYNNEKPNDESFVLFIDFWKFTIYFTFKSSLN